MTELESPNVMPKFITFLSSLLQRVAESNDLNSQFQPQKFSVFRGLTRPTISIQSHLERIFKYANCSPSSFIVAYVYLDRYYNNAYYAKVGGISTIEMNYLEVDFLFGLGFHLNVTPNTFHTYCCYLQREMMLQPPSLAEYPLNLGRSLKFHLCFDDDEASHQNEQLSINKHLM
uniref:Cyclin n=1 Tax=Manihot esculenta TaxID=3983 RepID=A0A2C9WPI8_MANES